MIDDFRRLGREHAKRVFADAKRAAHKGRKVDIDATVADYRAAFAKVGATDEEIAAWLEAFAARLESRLAASTAVNNAVAGALEREIAVALAKAPPKGRARATRSDAVDERSRRRDPRRGPLR